jgi:hypothetical protein
MTTRPFISEEMRPVPTYAVLVAPRALRSLGNKLYICAARLPITAHTAARSGSESRSAMGALLDLQKLFHLGDDLQGLHRLVMYAFAPSASVRWRSLASLRWR